MRARGPRSQGPLQAHRKILIRELGNAQGQRRWDAAAGGMNMGMIWANGLTALRLAGAPFAAWTAAAERWDLALALFAFAIASDALDGPLARRFGQPSAWGGLFDHGADCVFVTCALGGLAASGWLPWLPVALIPAAFAQYALDSRALAGRPLRTSALGRINGLCYFALAGAVIGPQALGLGWPPLPLIETFAWVLAASTAISMSERLIHLLRRRTP